jgi:hypothetical protein
MCIFPRAYRNEFNIILKIPTGKYRRNTGIKWIDELRFTKASYETNEKKLEKK